MDQATLEMVNNKSGYMKDGIAKINNQMLEVLCKLLSRDTYMRGELRAFTQNSQEPYEIPYPVFFELIDNICSRSDTILSLGAERFERMNWLEKYTEQYNDALEQYGEFRKGEEDHKYFTTNLFSDEAKMKTFINLTFNLEQESKRLCIVRDLNNAKDDIAKNLSYFLDENTVQEYNDKYNEALNTNNIDEMKRILDSAQTLILNHWKEYVTSIENFKQGDNFKFICHSTDRINFNSEFYTRYVSTSLLSEKLMDTFREGFGFVFAPENIVGACSEDMYVYNGSDNEDNLLFYSTLKQIDAPERLIEECVELKKQNKENGNKQKVYNEVVIDGFKPIAIFCLTEGAKDLNHNYRYAHKLQEKFPNLKIIEIDTTYYKTDEDLFDAKKELMTAASERILERRLYYQSMSISEQFNARNVTNEQVDRNEIFWTKFLELKKTGNYTEDDIVNLYSHVKEMNSFFLDVKTLDQYDDIELASILKNNYSIGTKTIFNKDLSIRDLERVYNKFKEYGNIDRLDRVMPGIKAFIELFEKKMFTDEIIAEMYKISSYEPLIEYAKMSGIEKENIEETDQPIEEVNTQPEEDNRSEELLKQAQKYIDEITKYQKSKQENSALIDEYNKCQKVCDFEYFYELCIMDIDWEKSNRLKNKEAFRYFESLEKSDSIKKIELEQKLQKLKKIHIIKIRKLKKQLALVNSELQENATKKQRALEDVNDINGKIDEIRNKLEQKTGVLFEEYKEKLEQAQTRMSEINKIDLSFKNIILDYNITDAQRELKIVEEELAQLGIDLESYMLSKDIETSNEEKIEDEKTI